MTPTISDECSASFDVVSGGVSVQQWTSSADPLRADRIFGAETPGNPYDDESWTRVQVWAFGPDTGGTTAQGAFGTLSVEPDGDWTYTLNNNAANVQALGQGQIATDSFNMRVTDAYGASTSRQFNVNVIGTGDGPQAPVTAVGGPAAETFVGSALADHFTGGGGPDLLIGLAGPDTFDFNHISEGGDTISDFTPGVGGDVLDIRQVLQGPVDPAMVFQFVFLGQSQTPTGASTQVVVDPDGFGPATPTVLATLLGVGGVSVQDLVDDGNLLLF